MFKYFGRSTQSLLTAYQQQPLAAYGLMRQAQAAAFGFSTNNVIVDINKNKY